MLPSRHCEVGSDGSLPVLPLFHRKSCMLPIFFQTPINDGNAECTQPVDCGKRYPALFPLPDLFPDETSCLSGKMRASHVRVPCCPWFGWFVDAVSCVWVRVVCEGRVARPGFRCRHGRTRWARILGSDHNHGFFRICGWHRNLGPIRLAPRACVGHVRCVILYEDCSNHSVNKRIQIHRLVYNTAVTQPTTATKR